MAEAVSFGDGERDTEDFVDHNVENAVKSSSRKNKWITVQSWLTRKIRVALKTSFGIFRHIT